MKYSKFAFIPFALTGIFLCLFLSTTSYTNRLNHSINKVKEKNQDYSTIQRKLTNFKTKKFFLCGSTFLLALLSSGLVFLSPITKQKEETHLPTSTTQTPSNWWWQLYLASWLFLLLMGSALYFFVDLPYYVELPIYESIALLFGFKGLFLIPANHLNNQLPEEEQNLYYTPLLLLETLIMCLAIFGLWFSYQLGQAYEEDWN